MFERDIRRLNPDATTKHLPGGVAPSRHAVLKQRNLVKRIARLDAERSERRRQINRNRADMVTAFLSYIAKALNVSISRSQMLPDRHGE